MSACSAPNSVAVMPRPNSVGSKPGRLTSASTSPLLGSSATTAPRCPASAASAVRCTLRSMASSRSSPAAGGRVRRFGTKEPWRSTERPRAVTSPQQQPRERAVVEAAARLDRALELADFLGTDELEPHEPRECVLEIRHFLGDHLELIGGLVAGDHLAVAVENQPARRGDRLIADPIALGEVGVVLVPGDLQHEQPHDEAEHA